MTKHLFSSDRICWIIRLGLEALRPGPNRSAACTTRGGSLNVTVVDVLRRASGEPWRRDEGCYRLSPAGL